MNDDQALTELQLWMSDLVRRRRALDKDPELAEIARRHVTGNERLSPVEQLEVYREQFWLRHTASLIEDFPGLGGVLGQSDWERLLEEYLERHPPTSFLMRDLGDRLASFVEQCEWLPQRQLSADMARLEWAYVEVFDAADTPPLDPAELANIPEHAWEQARIDLAPALRLIAVAHPVADLRRRIRAGHDPISLPAPEPRKLVIYRQARELYDAVVSAGAFSLLSALQAGTPLGAACAHAVTDVPQEAAEIEASVGTWFRRWAELGWIGHVRAL